jgi:RNA polymerase sigma-70 factor (ECF subfamily)
MASDREREAEERASRDDGASRSGEALLARLYRDHGPRLRRLFQRRGHGADEAADLQQDVFLRLARCDPALLAARPGQMVYRVARFVSIDAHRRRAMEHRLGLTPYANAAAMALADEAPAADERMQWLEELEAALALFQALPTRGGQALWLARIGELSHREIAELQGVSPRTVENQIAATAARFRDLLTSGRSAAA